MTDEYELDERLRLIYNFASDIVAIEKDTLSIGMRDKLSLLKDMADVEQFTLSEVQDIFETKEDDLSKNNIIISCDASITKNPGGQVAVGFVIRFPSEDKLPTIKMSNFTTSKTNNTGEYDAIYEALVFLFNHHNRPKHEVVVYSDSKLVVEQLKGNWEVNDKTLKRKCESIHELVSEGPVPVSIRWAPRNSTPDLAEANFLAQDKNKVPRH